MAAVTICSDFGAQRNKVCYKIKVCYKNKTVSTVSPSICPEVMGPNATILDFWMLSFKLFQSPLSLSPGSPAVLLVWSEVAQLCLTLCDPIDSSLPGSSVHGIFQAIVLEWIAISFSRGSSQPRDWTRVSRIVDALPSEPPGKSF